MKVLDELFLYPVSDKMDPQETPEVRTARARTQQEAFALRGRGSLLIKPLGTSSKLFSFGKSAKVKQSSQVAKPRRWKRPFGSGNQFLPLTGTSLHALCGVHHPTGPDAPTRTVAGGAVSLVLK